MNLVDLAERGRIPDVLVRMGIKRLLLKRLKQDAAQASEPGKSGFVEKMRCSPLALGTADANHQHYEVPTEVFARMLGPHLKYSCAYYPSSETTLAEAHPVPKLNGTALLILTIGLSCGILASSALVHPCTRLCCLA